jgi:adhesin/invasin
MTTCSSIATSIVVLVLLLAGCDGGGEGRCDPEAPGTICTIAGTGELVSSGDGGPAVDAAFKGVQDLAISPDGELWFLDFNNYTVRAIDGNGVVRRVVGIGSNHGDDAVAEPALEADFNHTTDLFFHDGYLYLAAWHAARVKRVDLATGLVENYAGAGGREVYAGDGGPAIDARLDLPTSVAADPDGNIVILDSGNQVIRRVDQDGIIERIAGNCVVASGSCDEGEELVECPGSNKTTCGGLDSCSDLCAGSFAGEGRHCLEMRMAMPTTNAAQPAGHLAYDANGDLLFADTLNNRIRLIGSDGIVRTIAGTGEAGYSGDGGPAVGAELSYPVDIAIADTGAIYFTDTGNHCVRKIDTSQIITTVAGTCGTHGFSGDGGDPTQATFFEPYGLVLDGDRMYVADRLNARIRAVNL